MACPATYSLGIYFFHRLPEVDECMGQAVAQLVDALRYKSEGRGFDSRWFHWNFSFT
jgi:hypothetical protein